MCGRFTITDPQEGLRALFGANDPPAYKPRYNVAPTQSVPVVRLNENGARGIAMLRWGLIPSWAKEAKIGAQMINARADTVAEKPAFRAAFKTRRCAVLADGFYEWKAEGKVKQPWRILLGDPARPRPFVFAGLWERWRDPAAAADAPAIESFTIITTDAAPAIEQIHHRMPVMLTKRDDIEAWLDPAKTPPAEAAKLLQPYSGADLTAVAVTTKVNNARFDGPECLEPADKIAP